MRSVIRNVRTLSSEADCCFTLVWRILSWIGPGGRFSPNRSLHLQFNEMLLASGTQEEVIDQGHTRSSFGICQTRTWKIICMFCTSGWTICPNLLQNIKSPPPKQMPCDRWCSVSPDSPLAQNAPPTSLSRKVEDPLNFPTSSFPTPRGVASNCLAIKR